MPVVMPIFPELIIFDCDGVLVDSEGASSSLIADVARTLGIPMSPEEAHRQFSGTTFSFVKASFEKKLKTILHDSLIEDMQAQMVRKMEDEAKVVKGAIALLNDVRQRGIAYRVASNSSREEMQAKFKRTGLTKYFTPDRIHSSFDVARPKPAPDVFLAAAHGEGCQSDRCLVIEDSFAGAKAAQDAGMACLLLREDGQKPQDPDQNLTVISALADVSRYLSSLKGEVS